MQPLISTVNKKILVGHNKIKGLSVKFFTAPKIRYENKKKEIKKVKKVKKIIKKTKSNQFKQ